jgi:hypothetical protein
MTIRDPHSLTSGTRIEQPDLPVSARRSEKIPRGVERDTLDSIAMAAQDRSRTLVVLQIPKFYGIFARSAGKDMRGGGVEQNLTDLTGRGIDASDRIKILRFPMFLTPIFERGRVHLPDTDFTVFSAGSNDRIDMRGPIGVEDGGGMTTSERYDIWKPVWKPRYRTGR